jgi:hypothetical protein
MQVVDGSQDVKRIDVRHGKNPRIGYIYYRKEESL